MVYENNVELEQLLGMHKIAFANLSAYVLKEYFSGTVLSLEKLIIEGQNAEVVIYLNKKDEKISTKIISACKKLNSKAITNFDNRLLKFTPVFNEN